MSRHTSLLFSLFFLNVYLLRATFAIATLKDLQNELTPLRLRFQCFRNFRLQNILLGSPNSSQMLGFCCSLYLYDLRFLYCYFPSFWAVKKKFHLVLTSACTISMNYPLIVNSNQPIRARVIL